MSGQALKGQKKIVSYDLGFKNFGVCIWELGEFKFETRDVSTDGSFDVGRRIRPVVLADTGADTIVVEKPYQSRARGGAFTLVNDLFSAYNSVAAACPSTTEFVGIDRITVTSWMKRHFPELTMTAYGDRKESAVLLTSSLLSHSRLPQAELSQANWCEFLSAQKKVDDAADAFLNLVCWMGLDYLDLDPTQQSVLPPPVLRPMSARACKAPPAAGPRRRKRAQSKAGRAVKPRLRRASGSSSGPRGCATSVASLQ